MQVKKTILSSSYFSLIVGIILVVSFMDRPTLGYIWQFPDEYGQKVIHANVLNYHNNDAKDLRLLVHLLDQDVFFESRWFDLDNFEVGAMTMYLPEIDIEDNSVAQISLLDKNRRIIDQRYIEIDSEDSW